MKPADVGILEWASNRDLYETFPFSFVYRGLVFVLFGIGPGAPKLIR